MELLAHVNKSTSEVLDWGSPVGLGIFIVSVAASLALLSWTIGVLSKIDADTKKRK